MDCEKFEQHLMDALFDELDEVTRAGMKRHSDSCTRCASLEAGMRATVEVGVLPLEEPSAELQERILEAARAAQRRAPWHRKLIQTIAWAGSHAMRPQLAMAAVLVLMIGSSILLLRARPGSIAVTPVKVTEQGSPSVSANGPVAAAATAVAEADESLLRGRSASADADQHAVAERAPAPAAEGQGAAPAQAAGPSPESVGAKGADGTAQAGQPDEQFERAMSNYRAGNLGEAQRDFAELSRRGGDRAAQAGVYEARVVRQQSGCRAALPYYTAVRERYGGTAAAADAAWEQADCYRILGEMAQAETIWRELASNASYHDRVLNELNARGQVAAAGKTGTQARNATAAPKAAGKNNAPPDTNANANQDNQQKRPAPNPVKNQGPPPQQQQPPPQQQQPQQSPQQVPQSADQERAELRPRGALL
jgi:hypothetical protein